MAMNTEEGYQTKNYQQKNTVKLKKRRMRKRPLKLLILLIAVVGVMYSPLFSVREIIVQGNAIVTDEKIISLSEIAEGERLYAVSLKKSAQNIEYYPYIESAEVKRRIPNKIIITVNERKPVGAVVIPSGYIQVSKDGRMLAIEPNIVNYNLPVISGVNLEEIPSPGNIIKNNSLAQALEIIEKCDQELLNNIAELNVGQADYILACTNEGIEIRLGDVQDINERLSDLNNILNRIVAQKIAVSDIEYIDMRYQNAPVIKKKQDENN